MNNINQQIKTTESNLKDAVAKLQEIRSLKQCDYDMETMCCNLEYTRRGLVKAKGAIKKYGEELCVSAYKEHMSGNGANTVGNGNTNRGDALICGGEYISTGKARFFDIAINF